MLPLLYLHRLSSLGFALALCQFLGSGQGLFAPTVTQLTSQWQDEAKAFAARDLSQVDFVYLWVDGIHLKVRLEQEKLCLLVMTGVRGLLVMIGVRADGKNKLVALADGYRESTESRAGLPRDAKRRGMRAPVLAMGDALGFRAALRDLFPETRDQRCWFHKSANVRAALPKSAHPGAITAMQQIYNAENGDLARVAAKAFGIDYGTKFPKAVAKIVDELDVLLKFYRYPAEHWVHLRTTNPTKSTFPTVRHRTKYQRSRLAQGRPGDDVQLIKAAELRWRAVNVPQLVAFVRAGATFRHGKLIERSDGHTDDQAVA